MTWWKWFVLAMVSGLLGLACAQKTTKVTSLPAVGESNALILGSVQGAAGNVERAKPLMTDAQGKHELNGASLNLAEAVRQLAAQRSAYLKSISEIEAVERERDTARTDLAAERNHWIGYKTRLWAKVLIGVAIATWAMLGVAAALFGWLLPASGVAVRILNFLPFANPFAWLMTWLKGRSAGGSVVNNINVGPTPAL